MAHLINSKGIPKPFRSARTIVKLVMVITAAALILRYIIGPKFLFSRQTQCIFYDKPPRTGSTTVARALYECLQSKGYTGITTPINSLERDEVIPDMLSHPGYRKSAVRKHVTVTPEQIRELWDSCNRLLYITSTRSMKERIWSKAKYRMTPKHRSSNLTDEQATKALRFALKDNETEERLEQYPFSASSTDIEPDYVIRADSLHDDLNRLLHSLQCPVDYTDRNVHKVKGEEEADAIQAAKIQLKKSDHKHQYLLEVAKMRNDEGLAIAAEM